MDKRELDFVDEYYTNVDLALLKKLTLIVPTYDRNYYLSRCLWYHAHFPFGQIIVADSSPENKKVVNRDTVKKIQEIFGANVLYLEYEPETEEYGGDVYRKWCDAVMHCETLYSQIVTDKEFLIPTALVSSILYLDQNLDYIAADARNYFIRKDKKTGEYVLNPRRQDRHSEIGENSFERFYDAFTLTPPISNCLIPSVMRTDCRKDIARYISEEQVNDIRFGELVQGFFGYLRGKFNYNSLDIMLIRDDSVIRSLKQQWNSPESSASRYPTTEDYYNNPDCQYLYDSFLSALKTDLLTHTNLSESDIESFVGRTYTNKYFLRHYLEKKTLRSRITSFYLVKKIWDSLPVYFKEMISRIYSYVFKRPLGVGRICPINIDEYKEVKVIETVIISTFPYHSTDRPLDI